MKKIFILFTLLVITACTTRMSAPEHLKREWMLISFNDFTKQELTELKGNINLTDQGDTKGRYIANMGCNNMFFTAQFSETGKVEFSQVGSTRMFCDRAMDLESAFSEALPKVKNYKIEGHFLTLTDQDGNVMKFVAADWD